MLICKPLLVKFFLTDFNGITIGNRPNFLYSIHRLLFRFFYDLELVVKILKKISYINFSFHTLYYQYQESNFRSFFQKNSSNGYMSCNGGLKLFCIWKSYSYFENSLFNSFKSNFCFSVILLGILTSILTNWSPLPYVPYRGSPFP